jgi:hypothetical protein
MAGAASPADQHSLSIVEFVSNLMGAVQFVNGLRLKRFQKYPLQDGDEIQLGDTVLIYREGI